MNTELIRRQEKIIIMPGVFMPTVPTVADHTQPGWLETDIYKGEYAFVKWGFKYRVYSRDEGGIFEILRLDDFMEYYNGILMSLDTMVEYIITEMSTRELKEAFVFTQAVPSDVWTIDHPLARKPSVIVLDSAGDEIEGDVAYISNDQVVLTFSAAFAGEAYLN
jgi:hypothetical protein